MHELQNAKRELFRELTVPWWHRPLAPLRPTGPDLRKCVNRIIDSIEELQRLLRRGSLTDAQGERLTQLLACVQKNGRLSADAARATYQGLQLLIVEVGDEHTLCGLIKGELRWSMSSTSWLTWDTLYNAEPPRFLASYCKGTSLRTEELAAARNMLGALYRARRDDELVQRARAEHRGRVLIIMAFVLGSLLAAFLFAAWFAVDKPPSVWEGVVIPLTGALGAALAGTFKARDTLSREAGIRSFAHALGAQLLVGATAAVFVYVLLRAFPIEVANVALNFDTLPEKAALGFVAGFSEPLLLKTVERVTKLTLGDEQDDESDKKNSKLGAGSGGAEQAKPHAGQGRKAS